MKIIKVRISPTGETKVETSGFAGAECHREAGELEAALGRKRKVVNTAEHYKKAIKRQAGGFRCES